jgi:hypothetical protein
MLLIRCRYSSVLLPMKPQVWLRTQKSVPSRIGVGGRQPCGQGKSTQPWVTCSWACASSGERTRLWRSASMAIMSVLVRPKAMPAERPRHRSWRGRKSPRRASRLRPCPSRCTAAGSGRATGPALERGADRLACRRWACELRRHIGARIAAYDVRQCRKRSARKCDPPLFPCQFPCRRARPSPTWLGKRMINMGYRG